MNHQTNGGIARRAKGQEGMALVLAIMALMLLTFLGLTLATTTSTELQIATNYRWSQQAYYNAEAGIEAAKTILRDIPPTTPWEVIMPQLRTGSWTVSDPAAAGTPNPPLGTPSADAFGNPLRNWENGECDMRGGRVGYGAVLNDQWDGNGVLQNVTTLFNQRLNGAVTVWIRRDYGVRNDGQMQDIGADNAVVITAEGVAPYTDGDVTGAFAQANQAVRTLEVAALRAVGDPCESYRAQTGNGVSGTNFAVCSSIVLDCGQGPGGPGTAADGQAIGGDQGGEAQLLDDAFNNDARSAGGNLAIGSGQAGTMRSLVDPLNPSGCKE